jgi:peroxiredoxin
MTIQVGDTIPDVKLNAVTGDRIEEVSTGALFAGKKAVLFGLPGAFTSTCSKSHLPGFVAVASEIRAAGADLIACVSVNDAAVMKAWAAAHDVGDSITMLADGNAAFTKALGLEVDLSVAHMGVRSQRYAAIVEDGKVTTLNVEKPRELEVSSGKAMLAALR